jgi:hypothetical protein
MLKLATSARNGDGARFVAVASFAVDGLIQSPRPCRQGR